MANQAAEMIASTLHLLDKGIWMGHRMRSLNRLGVEILDHFRTMIKDERDSAKRQRLAAVQRQALESLLCQFPDDTSPSRLTREAVAEYFCFLDQEADLTSTAPSE